jgi:hypothetical protein
VRTNRRELRADISDSELAAMTKSMDELHHDESLPKLRAAVAEWTEEIAAASPGHEAPNPSRRRFLIGTGGVIAAGGLLAACSSTPAAAHHNRHKSSGPAGTSGSGSGTTSGLSPADATSLAVDASIENLAVAAYTKGIDAATAGKLGAVPPAVPVFATTARSHHMAHAAAFNAVLTAAGLNAVHEPDPVLTPVVTKKFATVKNVGDLAELALLLENVAAQTYQADVGGLSSTHAIATTASIQPVEMTHAAILYFVLGKYPGIQTASGTPLAFNPTQLSRPNSDVSST